MQSQDFEREVQAVIELYERLNGRSAAYTRRMVAQKGAAAAVGELMKSAELQKGFKTLRDAGRLDQTFEALVGRYAQLFPQDVVEAAQWRLNHADTLLERD